MKCFWTRARQCPGTVEGRTSIRVGEVETWGRDSCAIHTSIAVREALVKVRADGRGSVHTRKYESPTRVRRLAEPPYRPPIVIDQALHRAMVTAQQATEPRETVQEFIIGAIEDRVERMIGNERITGEGRT